MLEKQELEELKSRLKDEFSDYYELAGGQNYRYRHLVTCHRIVGKLMQNSEIRRRDFDEEVVEVSALFHDIGRKKDIENGFLDPMETHEGHDETGREIVEEYVEDMVTREQLEKIKNVIGNHHSEPETVEGKIVQDADDLSNIGVNNLWRSIHYSADHERTLSEAIEYYWNEHVDQYLELIGELNFNYSQLKAKERMVRHKKAFMDIEKEMMAEDL